MYVVVSVHYLNPARNNAVEDFNPTYSGINPFVIAKARLARLLILNYPFLLQLKRPQIRIQLLSFSSNTCNSMIEGKQWLDEHYPILMEGRLL